MVIYLLISYLLGAIPFAYLIAGRKVMYKGSGNVGATNALYVSGSKFKGVLIGFLDVLKGWLALYITSLYSGNLLLSAVACVLGHNYNIFLKFKGGKGIAVTFGALIFLTGVYSLLLPPLLIGFRYLVKNYQLIKYELIEVVLRVIIISLAFYYFNNSWLVPLLVLQSFTVLKYITNGELKKQFNSKNKF